MKFLRHETRRFVGFMRVEFAKKSGKRGPIVGYIGVKGLLNAVTYVTLGIWFLFLVGVNVESVARGLFGAGKPGTIATWLSGAVGGSTTGRWVAAFVNERIIAAYGQTFVNFASFIRGDLIAFAGVTLIAYGLVGLAIAVGIFFRRKWGEYIAATASVIYLPISLYGIVAYQSLSAVTALVTNAALVWYLCKRKGLFSGYFAFKPDETGTPNPEGAAA
ncbi:MAG: DUF2127 domain-containing protein [Candidatus Aquicultorales bacterium]